MITREYVVSRLNELEGQFPVEHWKIKDIHIWPLIKNIAFYRWHRQYENSLTNLKRTIKRPNRFQRVVKKIYAHCFWMILKFLPGKKKVKILFCGAFTHRILDDGIFINRYFDPLIENLNISNSIFVEYGPVGKNARKSYSQYERILFLKEIAPILWKKGRNSLRRLHIEGEMLAEGLIEIGRIIEVDPQVIVDKLYNSLYHIEGHAIFFSKLIEKYKLEAAFGLCYYELGMYGMNLAAARYGIVSIDMQHGGIGPLHTAYSGFRTVPTTGFNIFPKIFWCWDDPSAEVIRQWAKNTAHRVVNGGNPFYLKKFANGHPVLDEVLKSGKKIITFTLQYSTIEEFILEAIKELKNDFTWFIRLHPRKRHERTEIEKLLQDADLISYVNLIEATALPLPQILMKTAVHVSKFSGSINEAYELGIANVIVGEIGRNQFQGLTQKTNVFFFNEKENAKLSEVIRMATTTTKPVDLSSVRQKIENEISCIIGRQSVVDQGSKTDNSFL